MSGYIGVLFGGVLGVYTLWLVLIVINYIIGA